MRYKQSREQSAELLRLILPLLTRHEAAFHPLSYAVWYEYLAGCNPPLRAAVDARLSVTPILGERDIEALFDQHVAMRDIESSARMRAEIARVVSEVDGATDAAGREVRDFGQELDGYRERLQQQQSREMVQQVVESLISDTTMVRARTEQFHEHLRRSSQEVERLREELELVQGLALSDPLSGLLNRRGFEQQLRRLGEPDLHGCSLLIIDIDQFKIVNDTHGHLFGDKVIVAVGDVLRNCVGERGAIARIGGEEFAVLLPNVAAGVAAELAERIRAAVQRGRTRRADGGARVGDVTVSIGVAEGVSGEDFETLLARADRALYNSKSAGRNRVTLAERAVTGAS
jgi:diguanylate cyclase